MPYHSPEKNIEIYYEISGNNNAPKMILIHGLFLNSDCWKFQLSEFESNFHILRFDLRGHGRSTKPKKRFTIRNYVDDMFSLLQYLDPTYAELDDHILSLLSISNASIAELPLL